MRWHGQVVRIMRVMRVGTLALVLRLCPIAQFWLDIKHGVDAVGRRRYRRVTRAVKRWLVAQRLLRIARGLRWPGFFGRIAPCSPSVVSHDKGQ